jgi:hypothetical protein
LRPASAPRRHRSHLVLLAAFLCPAGLAAGPDGPDPEVPADLLVSDLKIGPFYVKPTFAIENLGYDDNVFLEAVGQGDFTATFTPGARLALPFGDNVFSILGSVSYVYFQDFESERAWNWSAGGRLELVGGPVRLELDEIFRRTQDRFGTEITSRPLRHENETAVVVGTDREAGVYFEGSFNFNLVRFEENEVFADESLKEELDRNDLAAGLTGFVGPFGPARLIAGGELARSDFRTDASPRDSKGYFLYSGLRFEPDESVTGEVRIGYRTLDLDGAEVEDFSGLGLGGRLDFDLGDAAPITLGIRMERRPEFSSSVSTLYYVWTRFGASLTVPIAGRFALALTPDWSRGSYPGVAVDLGGSDRLDKLFSIEGAGIIEIGSGLSLRIGAMYRRLDSNQAGLAYEGTVLTTGFGYGL